MGLDLPPFRLGRGLPSFSGLASCSKSQTQKKSGGWSLLASWKEATEKLDAICLRVYSVRRVGFGS